MNESSHYITLYQTPTRAQKARTHARARTRTCAHTDTQTRHTYTHAHARTRTRTHTHRIIDGHMFVCFSAIRSSRCTSKAGDYSLRYLEGPETNPIQNISSTFYKTLDEPSKHFFIDPDWVSEGLTIKKLHLENKINPLRYGWI